MKKRLEKKIIYSMFCLVLGIVITVLAYGLGNLNETQSSFMGGFGISLAVVGFIMLIRNLTTLSNPKLLKDKEIEVNDERNIQISIRSMALTFRICILLQALASVVLVILDDVGGLYLGFSVGIELIVYLICYAFVSKKI